MTDAGLHVERRGHGEAIVLLHGFTQTGRCWGPVGDDLARDHLVLAPDAPGHGGSAHIAADLPTTAALTADAVAAALAGATDPAGHPATVPSHAGDPTGDRAAGATYQGDEPITGPTTDPTDHHATDSATDPAGHPGPAAGAPVWVGYSMGGRVALHVALARPEVVGGLVLVGAHPGIEDAAQRAERRASDARLAADLRRDGVDAFLDRWLALPLFAGLPAWARFDAERRRNTAEGLATSLELAGTGTQEPLWDRLGALAGTPVLAVAGAADAKFVAIAERMAAAIGPSAVVRTIPGAGHAAHLERPGAFGALVRGWLHGRAGNRAGPPSGERS